MSLATADDFQFVTVKRKKATILTCLPRNFEYSGKILKQTAGNGPVYIRLTSSLIKQSRVTSSLLVMILILNYQMQAQYIINQNLKYY